MEQKQYHTYRELQADYFTQSDLYKFLREKGFAASNFTYKKWEKSGIVPLAKRVSIGGIEFRVYNKDGSDFETIIKALESRSIRFVMKKIEKPAST